MQERWRQRQDVVRLLECWQRFQETVAGKIIIWAYQINNKTNSIFTCEIGIINNKDINKQEVVVVDSSGGVEVNSESRRTNKYF